MPTLDPESEKILGNVELLPSINNPADLPYQDIKGDESLIFQTVLHPSTNIVEKIYSLASFVVKK
jgi:hypothetical protein